MTPEVGEVLITAEAIAARVRELGRTLSRHYAGREPVLVAIMKGCVLFLADLVRAWPGAMDLEFVSAQSYDGAEAGDLRLALPPDLAKRVAGRPVIVVDDIYDTGRTLTAACRAIESLGAAEVRTIVLLRKTRPAVPGAPTNSSSATAWITTAGTATCRTWRCLPVTPARRLPGRGAVPDFLSARRFCIR